MLMEYMLYKQGLLKVVSGRQYMSYCIQLSPLSEILNTCPHVTWWKPFWCMSLTDHAFLTTYYV